MYIIIYYIYTHKILDLVFISEKNNSPSPYGFWITFRTVSFLAPKLLLKYSKEENGSQLQLHQHLSARRWSPLTAKLVP